MPARLLKESAAEILYNRQCKQSLYALEIFCPALLARRFFSDYTGGIKQDYLPGAIMPLPASDRITLPPCE